VSNTIISAGVQGLLQPAIQSVKPGGKVHQAAQQFESLLIGEMLKSAREAGGSGWLGAGDDDQAGAIGMEMAEQQFANMLAANGGLGLARMVENSLRASDSPRAASSSHDAAPDVAGSA
jgi:flagellar protein FlgJ